MHSERELRARQSDHADPLVTLLSEARLKRCRQLAAGNAERAVRLHQADAELAASLYGMLRAFEIGLRNSIDHRLREHLQTPDWILAPPPGLIWKDSERRVIADATKRASRSGAEIETLRVRHDRMVSSLNFGFWCHLFKRAYEHVLWKSALERLFPNRAIRGQEVFERLDALRDVRNRVAHHDAVLPHRARGARETVGWLLHEMTPIAGSTRSRELFSAMLSPHLERVARREAEYGIILNEITPAVPAGDRRG